MPQSPPTSRRIADDLRARIDNGDLPPGAWLPSERALARQHTCARNTARAAVALLERQGLVVACQGVGVRVAEDRWGWLRDLGDRELTRLREAVDDERRRRS